MSINNFISALWSDSILVQLRKKLVYASLANRDFEGQIKSVGDTVKINMIGDVTISDYTKDTDISAPQSLVDSQTNLTIERAKYFNFSIDDVDLAQASVDGKLMTEATSWAAYKLCDAIDQYVAAFYTSFALAAPTYPLGTQASPITPALPVYNLIGGGTVIYDYLIQVAQYLSDNAVPLIGRWCVIPPWAKAQLTLDPRFTGYNSPRAGELMASGRLQAGAQSLGIGQGSGPDATAIGGRDSGAGGGLEAYLGRVEGMDVYESVNCPHLAGTIGQQNSIDVVMAGHPMGITFAIGLNKVEAYRPPLRFADAMKGLVLYGAKVTRPSMLASFVIKHV